LSRDESATFRDEPHIQELTNEFLLDLHGSNGSIISETAGQSERFVGRSYMVRKLLAVLILLIVAVSIPSAACSRSASNPEDRARAVAYTQSLEEHPLAKDSLEKRMWLTEWIVLVPDFTVNVSRQEFKKLESLDKVNDTYSNQLRMQMLFSQAAFQLQHPEERSTARIQAAGLAGTLRAYRAIQQFDPTAKYPMLDNLMSLEKKGKLQKYVEKQNKSKKS